MLQFNALILDFWGQKWPKWGNNRLLPVKAFCDFGVLLWHLFGTFLGVILGIPKIQRCKGKILEEVKMIIFDIFREIGKSYFRGFYRKVPYAGTFR